MAEFLKIKTIFSNSKERNIDFLSNYYENTDKLIEIISELFLEEFLQDNVLKGKTILLKPNWVIHSSTLTDEVCLRTHNNFILATLEVVANQKPTKIIIADAPIQGCQWDKMITPVFLQQMNNVCQKHDVPLIIKDLRKITFNPTLNLKQKINQDEDYTIFNLGEESLLEPLSLNHRNPFRVTYYNPDRLKESHYPGTHKYCIANVFFLADIVISLPKVKTHQKSGITCALKNLVGINGDKDYLPHHRIGGSERGGDCYPGKNKIRYLSERVRDVANRNIGNRKYFFWVGISYLLWNVLPKKKTYSLSSSWHGNDTVWRMVMDLNKIAIYGKADGSISTIPQRVVYSLCDGIVGGQGDGPLNPIPLPLGIISFTNDSSINDIVMATLMGFDWKKIPLLRYLVKDKDINKTEVIINNNLKSVNSLREISIHTIPPPGWEEHLSTNNDKQIK